MKPLLRSAVALFILGTLLQGSGVGQNQREGGQRPPSIDAFAQLIKSSPATASSWNVHDEKKSEQDEVTHDLACTLLSGNGSDVIVRYRPANLEGTSAPASRENVFATDLDRMYVIDPKPSGGVTATASKFSEAAIAREPWVCAWYWPFQASALLKKADTWKTRTGSSGSVELVGHSVTSTLIIQLDARRKRVQKITSIGRRGGFTNTYTYNDGTTEPFGDLPSGGEHMRFRVERRADTLESAEPHDTYRTITFRQTAAYTQVDPHDIKIDERVYGSGGERVSLDQIRERRSRLGESALKSASAGSATVSASKPGTRWTWILTFGFVILCAAGGSKLLWNYLTK